MSGHLSICTLFEGNYHYGLGPLVNSLYANGYRGIIWAGYRGALPPWAQPRSAGPGFEEYQAAPGCVIRFVPLETPAHLTNYKPDFMLSLFDGLAGDADALFYFDPDIVVCEAWRYFEEWISCGVAVCEDVNSPYPLQHPRRIGWRRFFGERGIKLKPGEPYYANGGFIGVRREDRAFLEMWQRLQSHLWEALGGAQFAGIPGKESIEGRSGFFDGFRQPDQDALNATIEAIGDAVVVSFDNQQSMGFVPGRAMLPHALGPGKPWQRRDILEAFNGRPPRRVDKEYWRYADGPIHVFTQRRLSFRRRALKIAAAIGRFIRRN